jgi:hypothetical protein
MCTFSYNLVNMFAEESDLSTYLTIWCCELCVLDLETVYYYDLFTGDCVKLLNITILF